MFGTSESIRIPTLSNCETCQGHGTSDGRPPSTCATCRGGGQVLWDVGAGWITADGIIGPHGHTLLATTDVDHDGHPELISYERWANDYGLDVFGDATASIYNFSCGNI